MKIQLRREFEIQPLFRWLIHVDYARPKSQNFAWTIDLDLSAMGLGVIPASGKKIVWPEDTAAFTIQGNKIVSIKPYGDFAGIESFLAALGVTPPSA